MPLIDLASMCFVSSFLIYFIDKYKKNDIQIVILSIMTASLFGFLMVQRIELAIMFLALLFSMLLSFKVDKLPFYIGFIATIGFFLYYGGYDQKDMVDLATVLLGRKLPFFLSLVGVFMLDEFLPDKYPRVFRGRVLFPYLSLLLMATGVFDFIILIYYISFDLGYAIFGFTKVSFDK